MVNNIIVNLIQIVMKYILLLKKFKTIELSMSFINMTHEQAAINAKILKMALKNILIIKFKVLVSFILVMVVLI